MPERFKVVCTMQGAIQVLSFTFYLYLYYGTLKERSAADPVDYMHWKTTIIIIIIIGHYQNQLKHRKYCSPGSDSGLLSMTHYCYLQQPTQYASTSTAFPYHRQFAVINAFSESSKHRVPGYGPPPHWTPQPLSETASTRRTKWVLTLASSRYRHELR